MAEVEIITVEDEQVAIAEEPVIVTSVTKHSSLVGRYEDNQHSINAIEGLANALSSITTPRTIESDKIGVADYYIWEDGNQSNENRIGYFVTCNGNQTIKVCSGAEDEDIFGVTVSDAGFIGGQDPAIDRNHHYGLVSTGGFVDVRCESDVVAGNNVIANGLGIAKNSNTPYGNKVVAIKNYEGVRYAKIFLGMSPKQASDIAVDVISLETQMESVSSRIDDLEENSVDVGNRITTDVNITGGKIGGWEITDTDSVKGFTKTIGEYTTTINSAAQDSYVFDVSQQGESEGSLKFGVKANGDVDIANANIANANISNATIENADINNGTIGDWCVDDSGFRADKTIEGVCTISGLWTWKDEVVFTKDIEETINFTSNGEKFTAFRCNYDGQTISYLIDTSDVLAFNNGEIYDYGYVSVDFGTSMQYVSKEFYNLLVNCATPVSGAGFTEQGEVLCSVNLSGNIVDRNTKVFNISHNEQSEFYVKADGSLLCARGTVGIWNIDGDSMVCHKNVNGNEYAAAIQSSFVTADGREDANDPVFYISKNENPVFYVRSNGDAFITKGVIGGLNIYDGNISQSRNVNGTNYTALMSTSFYTENNQDKNDVVFGVYTTNETNETTIDWGFYARSNGELFAKNGRIGLWNIYKDHAMSSKANSYGFEDSVTFGYDNVSFIRGKNTNKLCSASISGDGLAFGMKKDDVLYAVGGIGYTDRSYVSEDGFEGLSIVTSGFNDVLKLYGHLKVTGGATVDQDVAIHGKIIGGLTVQGNILMEDGYVQHPNDQSDVRVKNTIEILPDSYEMLFDGLQPKRYKYNHGTSGRFHTGYIAQEVVSAIETAGLTTQDFAGVMLVDEGKENETWYLRRDEFTALNTWQIQKLKARVKELEDKIALLINQD